MRCKRSAFWGEHESWATPTTLLLKPNPLGLRKLAGTPKTGVCDVPETVFDSLLDEVMITSTNA